MPTSKFGIVAFVLCFMYIIYAYNTVHMMGLVSDVFKPLVTIVGDTLPETHHPSRR